MNRLRIGREQPTKTQSTTRRGKSFESRARRRFAGLQIDAEAMLVPARHVMDDDPNLIVRFGLDRVAFEIGNGSSLKASFFDKNSLMPIDMPGMNPKTADGDSGHGRSS
jgi:hypothetical protein